MQLFTRFVGGLGVALALSACGTVARSTGAMQLGPDTYRVASRASLGNVGESQKMALTEAQSYCKAASKELMVAGTRLLEAPGGGPFEVTFRCLAVGDSELQRPNLQPTPNTIIQVR